MRQWRRDLRNLWIRSFGRRRPRVTHADAAPAPRPEIDPRTLEQGLYQIEMLRRSGVDLSRKTLLDLGTGWQPTIPLLYYLAGCDDLILVDHRRVLDQELLARTAANLRVHAREISRRLGLTEREVVQGLRPPEDATLFGVLRHFHMQYLAPYDLLETTFAPDSIDLITSRAPLALYTRRYLANLVPAFARLLKPDGRLCICFEQKDRLEYLNLMRDSSCRQVIEESDTELRIVAADGEAPAEDPTRSLAFLVASCLHDEDEAATL